MVLDELVDVFLSHVFARLHRLWRDAADIDPLTLRCARVGLALAGGRHDGGAEGRHAAAWLTAILARASDRPLPRVHAIVHALSIGTSCPLCFWRRESAIVRRGHGRVLARRRLALRLRRLVAVAAGGELRAGVVSGQYLQAGVGRRVLLLLGGNMCEGSLLLRVGRARGGADGLRLRCGTRSWVA